MQKRLKYFRRIYDSFCSLHHWTKNVLAIDPGFRTGCKVVCLDKQGKLLYNETIYPHPPVSKVKEAVNKIESLVESYAIEAIAIGNGTGGRETEFFIKKLRFKKTSWQ